MNHSYASEDPLARFLSMSLSLFPPEQAGASLGVGRSLLPAFASDRIVLM